MIFGSLYERDWTIEWGRIIVEHSTRAFTFESDRLHSLHSLAIELCKAVNNSYTPETYFFGIWLVDIPEYILWASYRLGEKEVQPPFKRARRSKERLGYWNDIYIRMEKIIYRIGNHSQVF